MRELTYSEVHGVAGSGSYEAGYATGMFVGKTVIALGVVAGLYVAFATA
jgi:hypothetical protein